MAVEVAPKAAEPARPRVEGAKSDRIKPGAGQEPGGGDGDFAGLLSLSVAVADASESAVAATSDSAPTTTAVDKPPMDLAAMLALLAGMGDGQAPDAAAPPGADAAKQQPAGPSLRDGANSAAPSSALVAAGEIEGAAHPSDRGPDIAAEVMGKSRMDGKNPDTSPAADFVRSLTLAPESDTALVSAANALTQQPAGPGWRGVARSPVPALTLAGLTPAAGRSDAPVPEPVSSAKAGLALPLVPAHGATAAAGASGGDSNQTNSALAALLASVKGDALKGGRPHDGANEPVSPGPLSALGGLEDPARAPGRSPDKATETIGKPTMTGLNLGVGSLADSAGSLPVVSDTPAIQISDSMLADTVSYWVSQGVQSAELTLDGFAGEPIQVSIQLANGEAQIGFRSDVPEIRQVIEGAMSQLKDSLAGQGLVLAGVSVGTSDRQDRGPGEAQRRPPGRLRGVSLADPIMADPAPGQLRSAGHRLDLFV